MPSPLRTAVLALAPYLYWPLDESAGVVALDATGNGRTGTYNGAITRGIDGVPGDLGASAITFFPQPGVPPFKGVQRAGIPDSGASSWMFHFRNHVATFAASEVPFSWSGTNADGYYSQFNSANQDLEASIGTATGYVVARCPETLGDFSGHWNQVVITWDAVGPTYSLYVNGGLRAQLTGGIALHGTPPTTALTLGNFNFAAAAQQPYTGDFAHFAYFHSVLSFAQVQGLYQASGVQVAAVGNIVTATAVGAFPTSYTLGALNAGLTGNGTVAVPNCVGAVVDLTTVPVKWGKSDDVPIHYIPAVGRLQFSTLDGDDVGQLVHTPTQLIWAPNRMSQFLRYFFRAGVIASITPIISAQ